MEARALTAGFTPETKLALKKQSERGMVNQFR